MDNWVTKAAWKRGYRLWSKMNRKAMADLPGAITPKYHDYKVALSGANALSSSVNASYGHLGSTSSYSSDEWVQSEYVTEDPPDADPRNTDAYLAHIVGPHNGGHGNWTSVGLIASLNDTWPRVYDGGEPVLDADADTDPLSNLFDAGDNMDEVRLNLDDDNDEPPYNHDVMPGAATDTELTNAAVMRTSSGAGAWVSAPGFCIPFGLIEVVISDFGAGTAIGDVELMIDLVPGSYHGVYAERVI
jgi:hypothetical protein